MKFRTEVEIPISEKKIQISDSLFSIGSCFATEISVKLADSQFQTLNNPFGTLFNPWAVKNSIPVKNSIQEIFENKIYTEKDLDFHQGEYLSFNHHTSFSSENQKDTLRKINEKINLAHEFLKRSNWVIITYGTAFVYEHLAQNIFVANCHKIPQTNFNKRLLTHEELVNSITETCHILKKICPKEAQILFTLSPVRHTKDGFSENNLSKAKLLCAIHKVVEQHEKTAAISLCMKSLWMTCAITDSTRKTSSIRVNRQFSTFGKNSRKPIFLMRLIDFPTKTLK